MYYVSAVTVVYFGKAGINKEFSGHSLTQVVDCVRAEKIQKVLRSKIRLFVRDFRTQCASFVTKKGGAGSTPVPLTPNPSPSRGEGGRLPLTPKFTPAPGDEDVTCWDVWKALKASRKWPEFCQNTWAIEMGFSSYRRMYRACLAVWKQTPHQLEMVLIAEFLQLDETTEMATTISDEIQLSEIEEQVRALRCYSDDS